MSGEFPKSQQKIFQIEVVSLNFVARGRGLRLRLSDREWLGRHADKGKHPCAARVKPSLFAGTPWCTRRGTGSGSCSGAEL